MTTTPSTQMVDHAATLGVPFIDGTYTLCPTDTDDEYELSFQSNAGNDARYFTTEDLEENGERVIEQWALQCALRTVIHNVFNTFQVNGHPIADSADATVDGKHVIHMGEDFAHKLARFDR